MTIPVESTTSTLNHMNCSSSSFTTTPPSSSQPSTSSTFHNPNSRFEGLDLLLMAVTKVEGNGCWIGMDGEEKEDVRMTRKSTEKEKKNGEVMGEELGLEKKREKRHLKVPAKFQDSVLLQPWKRQKGRRQRKIDS